MLNLTFQRLRCWKCKAALDLLKLAHEFGDEEIVDAVLDNGLEKLIDSKIKMVEHVLKEKDRV